MPADIILPDLFTDNYLAQSLSDPPRGVSKLGYDPATHALYALSRVDWQVRRSSDQGATWTLVDSYPSPGGEGPNSFVSDELGNLYVVGTFFVSNSLYTTIIRKSVDHGLSWSTATQITGSGTYDAISVAGPEGGLFIVGFRIVAGNWIGTVRRSRDRGATWVIVYSGTGASRIAQDLRGKIYIAGSSGVDPQTWEVRVSENGGATWQTISPPNATAQFNGALDDMAVDAAGNLLLVGALDAWAVARRTAEGVWQDPEFPFGTEPGWVPSRAHAVAFDRVGNAFVAGWVRLGGFSDPRRSLLVQCRFADPPILGMFVSSGMAELFWTAGATNYVLEAAGSLESNSWDTVTNAPTPGATECTLQLPITGDTKFFRLRKP